MKVILLRDVAKLGKRHTIVSVPDGYAQNKLIPSGLALPATSANVKQLERVQAESTHQLAHDTDAFKAALKTLQTTPVTYIAEANAQGGLFQAVKASDIASAIVQAGIHGVPVDAIVLPQPLKAVGEHTINLATAGMTGQLQFIITAKV
jgi:large subunit ribosomal protein L9